MNISKTGITKIKNYYHRIPTEVLQYKITNKYLVLQLQDNQLYVLDLDQKLYLFSNFNDFNQKSIPINIIKEFQQTFNPTMIAKFQTRQKRIYLGLSDLELFEDHFYIIQLDKKVNYSDLKLKSYIFQPNYETDLVYEINSIVYILIDNKIFTCIDNQLQLIKENIQDLQIYQNQLLYKQNQEYFTINGESIYFNQKIIHTFLTFQILLDNNILIFKNNNSEIQFQTEQIQLDYLLEDLTHFRNLNLFFINDYTFMNLIGKVSQLQTGFSGIFVKVSLTVSFKNNRFIVNKGYFTQAENFNYQEDYLKLII